MNRRNFLKRCSLLPFVGSLAVVAKAGAPKGIKRSGTRLATKTEVEELYSNISDIEIWLSNEIKGIYGNPLKHFENCHKNRTDFGEYKICTCGLLLLLSKLEYPERIYPNFYEEQWQQRKAFENVYEYSKN